MIFHRAPKDHLQKLRRIVARLRDNEIHADDLDDFCKTAWHLIELVEKDSASDRELRKRAARLRTDRDIALCEHAANVEKHGKSKLTAAEKAGLASTEIRQGWGIGRFGKGGYGVGEQSITFKYEDGTERNALEFAEIVLKKW